MFIPKASLETESELRINVCFVTTMNCVEDICMKLVEKLELQHNAFEMGDPTGIF